jgi:hypothetical protein
VQETYVKALKGFFLVPAGNESSRLDLQNPAESRTPTDGQPRREFAQAEAVAVHHGNMESRRAALFRDRRGECRGHR